MSTEYNSCAASLKLKKFQNCQQFTNYFRIPEGKEKDPELEQGGHRRGNSSAGEDAAKLQGKSGYPRPQRL